MKKLTTLVFILLGFLISTCGSGDQITINTEITGSWRLIESYVDPGDGSGTFSTSDKGKTIEFKDNLTVNSNGNLCSMFESELVPSSGTYTLSDSTLTSPNCDYSVHFQLSNNNLIVWYPCFEGCAEKYIKTN
ncbi:MAG: lipocalin family protein [Cyclobacteriaceae bacterium]|nr:lipocalin family protein [Cyclobacteriaceae bacterium]